MGVFLTPKPSFPILGFFLPLCSVSGFATLGALRENFSLSPFGARPALKMGHRHFKGKPNSCRNDRHSKKGKTLENEQNWRVFVSHRHSIVRVGFLAERIFHGYFLGGRRIFSWIFSSDLFSSFLWKSAQKNPPGKSPAKSTKIYTTKIPDTFLETGHAKNWVSW